ncbi:MAG: lycopene cyclase domain-containing protein [Candidatus Curtissbacteria bacterium]|nr:lycopene cyclase domain-containing protein [Candidatus Curtissbacteria bacterium]
MKYTWLAGSLIMLGVWFLIFLKAKNKDTRVKMFRVSLVTSLLGFTEPIFVPKYWNPPSLFNLAQTTRFDVESLIFAFGIGGIASVAYEWLFKTKQMGMPSSQMHNTRHRYHLLALFSTPIIFGVLYFSTNFNPIYSTIIALSTGGLFTWYCRPDLKAKMVIGGLIFTICYFLIFLFLVLIDPDFVKKAWNLSAISGILVLGVPLEEIMFAFALGFMWSSVYEHVMWQKVIHSNR